MIRTIRAAFRAAANQDQSLLTALSWAVEDLRLEALGAGFNAGIPPLLLANLGELPGLLGRAEYACKTEWLTFLREGAIGDLLWQMNYEAAQDWE